MRAMSDWRPEERNESFAQELAGIGNNAFVQIHPRAWKMNMNSWVYEEKLEAGLPNSEPPARPSMNANGLGMPVELTTGGSGAKLMCSSVEIVSCGLGEDENWKGFAGMASWIFSSLFAKSDPYASHTVSGISVLDVNFWSKTSGRGRRFLMIPRSFTFSLCSCWNSSFRESRWIFFRSRVCLAMTRLRSRRKAISSLRVNSSVGRFLVHVSSSAAIAAAWRNFSNGVSFGGLVFCDTTMTVSVWVVDEDGVGTFETWFCFLVTRRFFFKFLAVSVHSRLLGALILVSMELTDLVVTGRGVCSVLALWLFSESSFSLSLQAETMTGGFSEGDCVLSSEDWRS